MTPLRPLRPRPLSAAGSSADDHAALDAGRFSIRRASRQRKTNSACDPCRKRKTKCDGRLPRCLMCEHRTEACAYTYSIRHRVTFPEGEEPRGHGSSHMVESLRTLPHEQALGLLSKLRNESGSPPPLPSSSHLIEQRHIRGLLPPSQNTLDFELTLRHPVAYPSLFPVSYADLPREEMLKSMTTPWLRRGQTAAPSPCPDVPPSKHAYMTPDQEDDENDDQLEIKMGSPYPGDADLLGPLFDERLRLLDISQWTPVAIPNDLAITAISHYLENDYATMPLFNADLFLQDLVGLENSFCSAFLVTAILCWACQALTPLHPEAAAYSVALFAQAQQHFSDQPQLNSLTTISALQILSMCAATYGKDDMSLQFLQESVSLGRLMGLFDVTSQFESAGMWLGNHEDWARTASYTAWGVYNWVCVYSLHYHIFEIETPPLLPKPGDSSASRPGIGSTTTTTTAAAAMTTALHAQVMSASSDMWIIFSDVLRRFYGPQDDDLLHHPPPSSLRFAEETYHRLLRWASALPLQLARAEENGHNVVMMHIYFHAVVTDLFRPFLDSPFRSERLPSFSTGFATPEAVYTASVTQLKRLLLLYRLRHKSASLSMLWKTAVVYVANATIREAGTATATTAVMTQLEPPDDDDNDNNTNNNNNNNSNKNNNNSNKYDNNDNEPTANERRFYLDLCLSALEDLYVSFPVFGSVAQGMVGMAMRHEAIPAEKAAGVLRRLAEIARRRAAGQGMTDKAEARWIVDFDLAMTNPEAAQGRYLAEQLEGLMLSESGAEDQC
ncbi:c6 transcription factor [Colletotrichum tabaci]|uniref:C6 transcription factor n=1 Tax=Colletotrichum tabaci TaxID=1209068 RepID=A0AAV9SYW9_9PEZI